MTGVVVLAVLAGLGTLGVLSGLRSSGPSLDVVWTTWSQPVGPREVGARRQPFADRLGSDYRLQLASAQYEVFTFLQSQYA